MLFDSLELPDTAAGLLALTRPRPVLVEQWRHAAAMLPGSAMVNASSIARALAEPSTLETAAAAIAYGFGGEQVTYVCSPEQRSEAELAMPDVTVISSLSDIAEALPLARGGSMIFDRAYLLSVATDPNASRRTEELCHSIVEATVGHGVFVVDGPRLSSLQSRSIEETAGPPSTPSASI